MNLFDEIRNKLSLKDYASRHMQLKQHGDKLLGLCPFHFEKTPSFYINNSKNVFYCFGCQEKGDLFNFYCKINKCEMKTALKELCSMLNINVVQKKQSDLNKLTNFLHEKLLNNEQAMQFLLNRGVNLNSIKKFQLGFFSSFQEVVQFVQSNCLKLKEYNFNENFFHMLNERIIFPIFNEKKQVITLAGRVLQNKENYSKYVNGPASALFNKSLSLYGPFEYTETVYLCEGYIDVIMLVQHGFNAFASMGTAFNENLLKIAFSYSNKIVLAFDADAAGQNTTGKTAKLALSFLSSKKQIKILLFPKTTDDPASFLLENSKLPEKEMAIYEYFFNQLNFNENTKEQVSEILNSFKAIPDVLVQKEFINKFLFLYKTKLKKTQNVLINKTKSNLPFLILCQHLLKNEITQEELKLILNNLTKEQTSEIDLFLKTNSFSQNFMQEVEKCQTVSSKENVLNFFINLNLETKKNLSTNFSNETWEKLKNSKNLNKS